MITLALVLVAVIVVAAVILSILSVPFLIILGLLPWALTVLGIILLIKALFEKPVRWENFMPAVIAFVVSAVLRWIF
ncbi:MAG TPA: phage-shock protein [Candidatus Galloscillospira excrementavium]|uniref:Phage-shock protein n=1 Tax=Candidatus Flavonifractor intestinigallinarum TaxID=2838586 RepID=A0A9D2MK04_9FIRM|nr:phage-shock protein [Candidatus Galloscillospira excrementavium]HJB79572.1 phage-shock protein [Candidatus Flavonifractor intestinigallinarum]